MQLGPAVDTRLLHQRHLPPTCKQCNEFPMYIMSVYIYYTCIYIYYTYIYYTCIYIIHVYMIYSTIYIYTVYYLQYMCVYIDINMYTGDISACHVCLPASSPGQRRGRICGGCPRRKMDLADLLVSLTVLPWCHQQ